MRRSQLFAVSLLTATPFACTGSDADGQEGVQSEVQTTEEVVAGASSPSGAPEVEERFQERIEEAWAEAVAGENPSTTCAAVKGRAVVAEPGAADRALAACNVDIPVRYFLTYLDRVESGEKSCIDLMTHMMTSLPAMTISTEGFREFSRREGTANMDGEAAAGAGAAVLAGAASEGSGAGDPRRIVKDRLRDRATEVCPDQTEVILR